MWRIFVAMPLPAEVIAELQRLQRELSAGLREASVSWTRREQMHLTLRFIGNASPAQADEIRNAVTAVCAESPPMELISREIGFFPNARRPRIIWAGAQDANKQLASLHSKVSQAIEPVVPLSNEEKDFCGHLTIGRIKHITGRDRQTLTELAKRASNCSFGTWTADSVEIIRSELGPGGSVYTRLASIGLGRASSSAKGAA